MARDPHGFRPLAVGRDGSLGRAQVLRVRLRNLRLRPDRRGLPGRCGAGRNGDRRPRRHDARALGARAAARAVRLRARLFLAPRFDRLRALGGGIARKAGPPAGARVPGGCRPRGAGARFGRGRGHRLCGRIRPAVPPGADPQSLRGPHLHRAFAGHPRFRSQAEAQSGAPPAARASAWFWWTIPSCAAPPAARSSAWCGRPARAKCTCAFPARRPSRRASTAWTRPRKRRADRRQPHRRGDPPVRRGRFARAISRSRRCAKRWPTTSARILLRLLHRRLSDRAGEHRRVDRRPPEATADEPFARRRHPDHRRNLRGGPRPNLGRLARLRSHRQNGGVARPGRPPGRRRRPHLRRQHRGRAAGRCAHSARGSRPAAAQRDPLALRRASAIRWRAKWCAP